MNRRALLTTVLTGLSATAGCTGTPSEPTPEPEPEASELRVSVDNNDTTTHSLSFVVKTTRDQSTTVVSFELTDIEPGETRTRDPETLAVGKYTLEIDLTTQEMGTETTWEGHNCPIKDIDIELREDGFSIQNRCVDE